MDFNEIINHIIFSERRGNMKAVLCPVCNGVGKVSSGFYNRSGDCPYWTSSGVNPEVCRGCNGVGWVEIGNADDRLKLIDSINYSQPHNRCPDCGGDRNSLALTGCRKGSHYGTQ